jgi:hypothetical protein
VGTSNVSIEAIVLPVTDVERALRFYVDQVGFLLDVDYSPSDAFRVVQLTPPTHFATSIWSSRIWKPRARACSNVRSRSVQSGTKPPSGLGTAPSHPGSTQLAETMPALRTFPIRMATVGYYRNVATGMFDALWTSGCNQWDGEVPFCHKCAPAHKLLIENTSHVAGNAIERKLDDSSGL